MKKYYLSCLFLLSSVFTETYFVPNDFNTIQSAINGSANGDSIIVSAGEYTESINFLGKEIFVSSRYLLDNDSTLIGLTVIDAQQNGSVVTFKNNESENSILQGFTLQNGNGNNEDPDGNGSFYTYGGGIYCEGSEPAIKDCIIQNNIANQGGGGGIFCYNASPSFYGCMISGNLTDDVGGGLYTRQSSSPQFFNCTFYNNTSEFGGGCYLRNESSAYMEDVTFQENTANNSGGGISLKDDSDLVGNKIKLIGNEADGLGGGLYINNANPDFSFLLIADNLASSGGGIYIRNNSTVSFSNATVANNSAGLYGDGMYLRDGSEITIVNSIFWNNGSNQVYFRSDGNEAELNIDYSLVQDLEDGININDNGDLNWGDNNIDEEPYFCNSPAGNYFLRENSPCLVSGQENDLIGSFESGCGPINTGPLWYVDLNGNDQNDGSLESPYESIERAMTSAVDGDTIRLFSGTYTELLDFQSKEVVLESRAFELGDMALIQETNFGSSMVGGSCLVLSGASNNNAIIRGLSFRGGSEPNGGGIVVSNCSPKLSHLIIEDNNAEIGGGLYLFQSDAELSDLTIRNNGANFGGGIYISGGNPLLNNVALENNIAYWGGGIYSQNSEFDIVNSAITMNEALIEGGALYQNNGIGNISWTAIQDNDGSDYGGAIVVNQATLDLDQITFAGNTSGVGSAVAMNSSVVSITNSILWFNNGSLFYAAAESGLTSLEIAFTNIEGGITSIEEMTGVLLTLGEQNMDLDPQFCDSQGSVYNLQESSPCLIASSSDGVLGAHELDCDEVLSVSRPPVPSKFSLYQNYPNPFNPSTEIRFEVFEFDTYELSVFNLNGQLVKTLFSNFKVPGSHVVTWNARDRNGVKVPSGVYLYLLKNSKNQESKKMILMK